MTAPMPPEPNSGFWLCVALIIGVVDIFLLVLWGGSTFVPAWTGWEARIFASDLTRRSTTIIGMVVVFLVMLVLTIAAKDGLFGKFRLFIPSFFLFLLFFLLMSAWV